MKKVHRDDLLHPELSFQIAGILFEVSNTLGFGFKENYYQKAMAKLLDKAGIKYKEQVKVELKINGEPIGHGYTDFIIEEKIIHELKKGDKFMRNNIDQLHGYLKMTELELGILANFTSKGLIFKRIVNINQERNHISNSFHS